MSRRSKKSSAPLVRLLASAVLVLASLGATLLPADLAGRLFPAYRALVRRVIGAQAQVAAIAPFALWDVGAALVAVALLVALVRRVRSGKRVLPALSWACLVASLSLAAFAGWALDHHAPPLAAEIGLEVGEYSPAELESATRYYLQEAAERAAQVPREKDGSLAEQDFFELAQVAGSGYARLTHLSGLFEGPTEPVKALLVAGEPLLYSGHTGIFWAATGEACVAVNCAAADLPFVMCHEAAHRLAIASEQEANFAAFLACSASDDVRLAYSGYYNAFVYCFNALYRQSPDAAVALLEEAAASGSGEGVCLVWADRTATREHYAAYDGTFEKVGSTVNDGYLKSFGEAEGVRSYGLVVDYLIAWHASGRNVGDQLL